MWFHTQLNTSNVQAKVKRKLQETSSLAIQVISNWSSLKHRKQKHWFARDFQSFHLGTFIWSSSLQMNLDLKEPRWLLTSIPQKPIAAFNHPNQHVGIRQHQTVSDRHQSEKGFISRSGPILSPQQVFSPLRFSYTRQWPILMLLTIMSHRLKSHSLVVTPSIHFKAHGHLFRNRTLSF